MAGPGSGSSTRIGVEHIQKDGVISSLRIVVRHWIDVAEIRCAIAKVPVEQVRCNTTGNCGAKRDRAALAGRWEREVRENRARLYAYWMACSGNSPVRLVHCQSGCKCSR